MEQPHPPSPTKTTPDSSETTAITATFPDEVSTADVEQRSRMTEIELGRSTVTSSRHRIYSLLDRLSGIQQRLSSDLGFEREQDNLSATRQWAADVNDVAWEAVTKSAELIDMVDYLMLKLEEEAEEEAAFERWVVEESEHEREVNRVLAKSAEEEEVDEGCAEDDEFDEQDEEGKEDDEESGENDKDGDEMEVNGQAQENRMDER